MKHSTNINFQAYKYVSYLFLEFYFSFYYDSPHPYSQSNMETWVHGWHIVFPREGYYLFRVAWHTHIYTCNFTFMNCQWLLGLYCFDILCVKCHFQKYRNIIASDRLLFNAKWAAVVISWKQVTFWWDDALYYLDQGINIFILLAHWKKVHGQTCHLTQETVPQIHSNQSLYLLLNAVC